MGIATVLAATTALLSVVPATADTRPVNISNAWYLPDMDSSVFLRHFREKVTWPEAESICRQHHGTLATVEGSRDFDATRYYLVREGASATVWIGLRRARPGGDFMWINSHPMRMEGGYWLESLPSHSSPPLCVALDPSADFRWRAKGCGPESTATFLCQLPVPLWVGRGEGGCLPSLPPSSAAPMSWLTIMYLPEQGALDLTADCGPRGQRQLACKKGTTTGEELGWRLSCSEDVRLHMDDHGMRRGRSQTHAPPTRHRRDLTGTSMTTTQASSPSLVPLEAQSMPLPSPLPTDTQGTTIPPAAVLSSSYPEQQHLQNGTTEVSSTVQLTSSQVSSPSSSSPSSSPSNGAPPFGTFFTSTANTTSQSPGLRLPTSKPTPTHNLTVSLTVVISPASSEENDSTDLIQEFSKGFPGSPPSGEVISITNVPQDPPQLPVKIESLQMPSKSGAQAINIDVVYVEPTSSPPVSPDELSRGKSTEAPSKSSSVSFTPKSPPNLDESTSSSMAGSTTTQSLNPESSQASEVSQVGDTVKPSQAPVPQSKTSFPIPVSMLPMKVSLQTSDPPQISSSNADSLNLSHLLSPTTIETKTHPPASETFAQTTESPALTTEAAPATYVPDTRVETMKGFTPSSLDKPSAKSIKITAIDSDKLEEKVVSPKQETEFKESPKDFTQDKIQNEVLKADNEIDNGFQWVKIGNDKEEDGTAQSTELHSKDDSTLTLVPISGVAATGRASSVSSTNDASGHTGEFDGEWTEVGTLDPVSERFLEDRGDVDTDISSPPPRPNRSRKLTRPQGRSFYTYFLSRVLG